MLAAGGKGAKSFVDRCIAYVGENAIECVKTNSFLNLPKDALIKLISSDCLALEEEDVWRAVLNWAKYQAGVTQPTAHWTEEERVRVCQHLGGVINYVRLLLIDSQVFAEEVEPTGAVPMELSLERYRYAALPNKFRENSEDKRLQPRVSLKLFLGSQILVQEKTCYQRVLNNWYGCAKQVWRLVYRASSHGYSAESFHRHCDGVAPTYVIVLGARSEICGGFSDVPWGKTNTKGHYIPLEKAFLFTLTNNQDMPPTKYDIIKKMFAICYHPDCGPIFGAGADLLIASNCNTNMDSYSNLPHSYDGDNASCSILMGDYNFSVIDYEVFTPVGGKSLHVALDQLGRNSQELSGLQLELSNQHHSQLDTREAALQARETEIKVARENLEKQRAMSEEERKRLVSLVTQLEQKLVEQTQINEEEKWNLRQEASCLDTATKIFEKERERALQQIDREKQQLQIMKESMLSEQQILSEQLQQEKLSLASEKSRLDTLAKLHGPKSPDVMKMRAELEAALKVAQDASVQLEAESEKLRSRQQHLDKEKRRLEDFEHDVASRARELETLTKLAIAAREEGRKALEEARRMELQRSEHTADIQRQLTELREREKRLAQEKVYISEERLALQHEKSKVLCSYCRRQAGIPIMSPPPTPPDLHTKFVDPKVIIMRLSAEDEASRLEQESHFLSSQASASK